MSLMPDRIKTENMIKLTNLIGIWLADSIPQYIADSMERHMLKLCRKYMTLDISDSVAFYYVEAPCDFDKLSLIFHGERIENAQPRYIEILKDIETGRCCYRADYVIHTDFEIVVFCEHDTARLIPSARQDIADSSPPSSEQI